MTDATKRVVSAVAFGLTVLGAVEWRLQAAEDQPKEVERRLEARIKRNDSSARERSEFFKDQHRQKEQQLERIEGKIDALILHMATDDE